MSFCVLYGGTNGGNNGGNNGETNFRLISPFKERQFTEVKV